MTNEEKFQKTFSHLHASQETYSEVIRMTNNRKSNKMYGVKRFSKAVAAACLVLVLGATAYAASQYRLADWFDGLFSSETAQEQIKTDLDVTVSGQEHMPADLDEDSLAMWESWQVLKDNSPVILVKEAEYDGKNLYIVAETTKNGESYHLGSNRLYINDTAECPVITQVDEAARENGYAFVADLSGLDLQGEFTVTLPVNVYSKNEKTRYQNQEYTFTMSANDLAGSYSNEQKQIFTHPEYTLTVERTVVSNTGLVTVYGHVDQNEKIGNATVAFELVKSDGETLIMKDNDLENMSENSFDVTLTYSGVEKDAKTVTVAARIVPEGGYVSDSSIVYQDNVELKNK